MSLDDGMRLSLVPKYVCMYVCMYICRYVCMYVCVCICIYMYVQCLQGAESIEGIG